MEKQTLPVFEQIIQINSFGQRRHLYIDEDKISYAGTTLLLKDITDLKHGINKLQFQAYAFGSIYILHLKAADKHLELVFTSILGIQDAYFFNLYDQLLQVIWEATGDQVFTRKVQELKSTTGLMVGSCLFQLSGVSLKRHHLFSQVNQVIPWEELSYQIKYNRLSLYSKSKSTLWVDLYFTQEWNVDILCDILEWLYHDNGLAELRNAT